VIFPSGFRQVIGDKFGDFADFFEITRLTAAKVLNPAALLAFSLV
jgi:hypothetical protein